MRPSNNGLSLVVGTSGTGASRSRSRPSFFGLFKLLFDLAGALLLVSASLLVALVLLGLNPWFNPGPLFYIQTRMGRDCRPFRAIKFRTMLPATDLARGAFDGLEEDRITPLGRWLRRTRLDELPQGFNVLAGEMSLIGPRPDYFDHACTYLGVVPGYRDRHAVKPGITGLAQIEVGYACGLETVSRKVNADLVYIAKRSILLDLSIAWRTLKVMVTRQGT
ncbi:MAG: sugar transferase [Rubellimicrobium sp.]|nr:sugar transferase [Rubellimicrobium sp.]